MNDSLKIIAGAIIKKIELDPPDIISREIVAKITLRHTDKNGNLIRESATDADIQEIINIVIDRFYLDSSFKTDRVSMNPSSLFDPSDHVEWQPVENGFYWNKHREFLIRSNKFSNDALGSINDHTTEILSKIEDPNRIEFNSCGLVLGHVQSGKTSNFSVLISKAADQGYRFIIVLAGIHTILRKQTQLRLDKEITGYNTLNSENGKFVQWNIFESSKRWKSLTKVCKSYQEKDEDGEFNPSSLHLFDEEFLDENKPVICVIKKNCSVLEKLIGWIKTGSLENLSNLPVLIIDDEADQASINGRQNKKDPNTNPTITNQKIRELLNLFKRRAYIGYTATPYANILQKEENDPKFGSDLYPKNFIHSLPQPKGYFGVDLIFNKDHSLSEYFRKIVPNSNTKKEKELSTLLNLGEITDDLINAIWDFFFSIAFKKLRGLDHEPMSMMINVSTKKIDMQRIAKIVNDYVYNSINLNTFKNTILFSSFFENYCNRTSNLNKSLVKNKIIKEENKIFSWESTCTIIRQILNNKEIDILEITSDSGEELDYVNNPNLKVIAIGGYKLSRGLTLEGLMTSYYLRVTRQSDSLYQMGRWFGYRKGYEDLIRIYSNTKAWSNFESLVNLDKLLRVELDRMIDIGGYTPNDFTLCVQKIKNMLPTSPGKMGGAIDRISVRNREFSLLYIPLDNQNLLSQNNERLISLHENISKYKKPLKENYEKEYSSLLYNDIECDLVSDFLTSFSYGFDESNLRAYKSFRYKQILQQIDKNGANWDILFCSKQDLTPSENTKVELNQNYSIISSGRSREKEKREEDLYYIRALSDPSDRLFALSDKDSYNRPKLLIYHLSPEYNRDKQIGHTVGLFSHKPKTAKLITPYLFSIIFPNDYHAPYDAHMTTRGNIL